MDKDYKLCSRCMNETFKVEILEHQVNLGCTRCGYGIVVTRNPNLVQQPYDPKEPEKYYEWKDIPQEVKEALRGLHEEIKKVGWKIRDIGLERIQ